MHPKIESRINYIYEIRIKKECLKKFHNFKVCSIRVENLSIWYKIASKTVQKEVRPHNSDNFRKKMFIFLLF